MNGLFSFLNRLMGVQWNFFRAVIHAWLFVFSLSLVLGFFAIRVLWLSALPAPIDLPPSFNDLFLVVIFAPLGETLLLSLVVYLLRRGLKVTSPLPICVVVALLAGLTHGVAIPAWFITAFGAFFILTFMYLTWYAEGPSARGYWAACLPHALNNLSAIIFIWAWDLVD
jgi:hypothetical protein